SRGFHPPQEDPGPDFLRRPNPTRGTGRARRAPKRRTTRARFRRAPSVSGRGYSFSVFSEENTDPCVSTRERFQASPMGVSRGDFVPHANSIFLFQLIQKTPEGEQVLVGCLERLSAEGEGLLGIDQLNDLFDRFHVGTFEKTLL